MTMSSDYFDNFLESEWKEISAEESIHAFRDENITLADVPTLIVGIGGTGIAAARKVKEGIERNYHPNEAQRMEYLFVDTDASSVVGLKGSDTLIIQNADTAVLLREYKDKGPKSLISLPPEITDWLDPNLSPFRVMNGAAGIRQAGRLILFLNINRVLYILKKKIDKISTRYDLQQTRIKVHLFTGIGGGTGSGMFIDIAYLLRAICNCEIQGFVFMPDVSCLKTGLQEVHRKNIKRNGFAALKELDQLLTMELYNEKFEQRYPGNAASISTSYPVFDYCVLIGSMQDGRKRMESEEEIFDRVAEYLLLELHQKEAGAHDFESHKSNLAVDPRDDLVFTKYVSVDADAYYLRTDLFFSWWLKDVFDFIATRTNKKDVKQMGLYREIHEKAKALWNTREKDIRLPLRARAEKSKDLINTLMTDLHSPNGQSCAFPSTVEGKLSLLGQSFVDITPDSLTAQLTQDVFSERKARIGILYRKRWGFFADCFMSALEQMGLQGNMDWYKENAEDFYLLMGKISGKCQKYNSSHPSDKFDDKVHQIFETIKTKNKRRFEESIEKAAEKIVENFMSSPDLWTGKVAFNQETALSDHVAALVRDCYARSGCASISDQFSDVSGAGTYAVRDKVEEEILKKLHAAPLWPIRAGVLAGTIDKFQLMRVIAYPNSPEMESCVKSWIQTSSDYISPYPNKIHDRIAQGVYAFGYALKHYYGAEDFEKEYNEAATKAGLHLFAGACEGWNRPFSPLFSYDWSNESQDTKQDEARHYVEIFKKAKETDLPGTDQKIICYNKDRKRYAYQLEQGGPIFWIGAITGANTDEFLQKTIELFIRSGKIRNEVENLINTIGSSGGQNQ